MLRLIRTRTYRQLLTQIQELHDRATARDRARLAAEYRITQALKVLEGEDTELSTRLTDILTGDGLFIASPADSHDVAQACR